MNHHSYTYSYPGPGESFEDLGLLFDSSVINNSITIPAKKGNGYIKRIDAANGVHIHLWNLQLHDDLRLKRPAMHSPVNNVLSLFYIFTPDYFTITHGGDGTESAGIPLKSLTLTSEGINLDFFVKAWQPVRMIQVDITREWLTEEYVNSSETCSPAYNRFLSSNEPVLFTESASFDTAHTFSSLLHHLGRETTDPFYLKAKTLSLLCDILLLFGKQHETVAENNTVHEKMLAVEKILDDCLETSLPSISAIAKQMALSESTLKRNFKQSYGTSIYEYYLQKKMKMARQIFAEHPVPVKEVAYRLGYEKVSNFIQMFKKYYHFSPGRLKKTAGFIEGSEVNRE